MRGNGTGRIRAHKPLEKDLVVQCPYCRARTGNPCLTKDYGAPAAFTHQARKKKRKKIYGTT